MRTALITILGTLTFGITNFAVCAVPTTLPAESQVLPQFTTLPVRFEHSIDATRAKTGDAVQAKTLQVVVLPEGKTIARGTELVGHIVAVQAFHFDTTPYAHQSPSTLSIHFDKLQTGDTVIPVNLSVRAIASTQESQEASSPHYSDESDHIGTTKLIGGTQFSNWDKMIQGDSGDAIGYHRKDGVFARLIASGSCSGTNTEQSVAIYSPDACGAYGFVGDYLADTGHDGSGTFTLAVRGRSLKLYAGSTALLEVNDTNNASK